MSVSTDDLGLPVYIEKAIEADESQKKLAFRIYRRGNSVKTVIGYVAAVTRFCRWLNRSPDELISSKIDWAAVLNEYLDDLMVAQKLSGNSAHLAVASVKKWLKVNGVHDVRWDDVETPKIWHVERDRVPTKEELREILSYANLSDKVLVMFACSSGLRVGAILGLQIKDLKLDRNYPVIVMKPEMAKDRPTKGYISFITPETKSHLMAYLKQREMRGEKITPDSPVISAERPAGKPISDKSVSYRWHQLLQKASKDMRGRKWYVLRFHTLRKYFQTWCRLSGVDPWITEAFMGHRSGIHQTYFMSGIEDMNNPQQLEILEKEYKKALPALTIFSEAEKVKELESKLEDQMKMFDDEKQRFEIEKQSWDEKFRAMDKMVKETLKIVDERQSEIRK